MNVILQTLVVYAFILNHRYQMTIIMKHVSIASIIFVFMMSSAFSEVLLCSFDQCFYHLPACIVVSSRYFPFIMEGIIYLVFLFVSILFLLTSSCSAYMSGQGFCRNALR